MLTFKKIGALLLRICVSVILLVLLFRFNKIDIHDLASDIKGADKALLAIGLAILFIIYLIGFLRWRMLLKAVGVNIPFKRLIISFSGGLFFNIFLPSTIGGDVVRTADLAGHTRKAKEVIATVLLDRLSGYIGLVIVILPALLLGRGLIQDKVVISSVLAIIALLFFILLILFNTFIYSKIAGFLSTPGAGKIKEMIKDLHEEIHIFRQRRKMIFYNLAMSSLIQFIAPISTYLIALSLGVKINIIYFFIFLPIIGAITLLPVAISGLGLRESLFVVYFAKAGVVKQLAVAMSLLSFFFVVIFAAVGGLIYVFTLHNRRLQCDQSSQLQEAHS